MLSQLKLKNVALIPDLELDFAPGLNVLTGETGAGKSIIIDAVSMLTGARGSTDLVRHGTDKATIEGYFHVNKRNIENLNLLLNEWGFEGSDESGLLLSRDISLNSKSNCRINGNLATVAMLKKIGQLIVDIHGQSESFSLLETNTHRELLDSFAGRNVMDKVININDLYCKINNLEKIIRSLGGDENERNRLLDSLEYQINEINSACLNPGEDITLEQEKILLCNAEKFHSSIYQVCYLLEQGDNNLIPVNSLLSKASKCLNGVIDLDDLFKTAQESIDSTKFILSDLVNELNKYIENIDFSPMRLEEVERRLFQLSKIKSKYGKDIDAVLEYCHNIEEQYNNLKNAEQKIKEYENRKLDLWNEYKLEAVNLTNARKTAANFFEEKVSMQLEDLEMKKTKVKISFNDKTADENGVDDIEILISPNPGEPLKPLSKIASGGELSRIMLAIKTIFSSVDPVSVQIFDEIDSGIGGRAVQSVAEKLHDIAEENQVICVTHSPQIAAMADYHVCIKKSISDGVTEIKALNLTTEERIAEIARMLAGAKISESALEHAKKMLDMALNMRMKKQSKETSL